MHVRMVVIRMQRHGVPVLQLPFIERQLAHGLKNLVRWRSGWHREDDVMHELRGLATAYRALRARVSLEVQIPVLGELTLKSFTIEMLTGIRFKPELALAPDVIHVLLDSRDCSSAT